MQRIRPWLYVGKYRETADLDILSVYRIQAMLQLAEHVEQPGIASLYIAVDDGVTLSPEKLRQGVDFVREQKAAGKTVLVACGAGISRSVTYTIAAMHEEENISLVDAYTQILDVHPDALPHMALWDSLCSYYNESVPYQDIWLNIQRLRHDRK